ncbi:MAG TPA: alpha/beta hydrolase [Thermomonospora sp.]|nr:alpha/beta hydrolase [Thermomonospora sp.]
MTGPNDLGELKRHVLVHARGQKLDPARYRAILRRIEHDEDGPGSWVAEWSRAARDLEERGRLLDACRHYAMARFPFVNGDARREAHERCVAVFDRWRRDVPGIERLDLDLPGGRVRCWAAGLAPGRPLMLIMGGIVTVKEQWAPMLARGERLGLAGVVLELPGVGENTLPYDSGSPRMLSALLDALADRADVDRTYALAMSFAGHLALRCATEDPRIRGVATTGAPVSGFFTDTAWQRDAVPRVTTDTLAHLVGTKPADVYDEIRDWALTGEALASLDIPVHYAASLRDEIIPPGETAHLRRHLRSFHLMENDDVHGSPRHAAEVGLWTLLAILRMADAPRVPRALLTSAFLAARARRRLLGPAR